MLSWGHLNEGRYLSYILPWSLLRASSASPWWYSSHLKMFEYYLSLILNCKHRISLVYHQLLSLVQCLAMFAYWLTYCSLLHNLAHNKSQPSSYKAASPAPERTFLTENTVSTCIFQGMEEKKQCECAINQRQRAFIAHCKAFSWSSSLRCLLPVKQFLG